MFFVWFIARILKDAQEDQTTYPLWLSSSSTDLLLPAYTIMSLFIEVNGFYPLTQVTENAK